MGPAEVGITIRQDPVVLLIPDGRISTPPVLSAELDTDPTGTGIRRDLVADPVEAGITIRQGQDASTTK